MKRSHRDPFPIEPSRQPSPDFWPGIRVAPTDARESSSPMVAVGSTIMPDGKPFASASWATSPSPAISRRRSGRRPGSGHGPESASFEPVATF